ncbi:MAG: hypothetical protein SPJ97_00100 [Bacteroides sp.]|nr:hypothetical protein [Bacteroides sp.]
MEKKKNLSRVPRVITDKHNEVLLNKLWEHSGNVGVDLVLFLANKQRENLFSECWFSIMDFCEAMGYERTNLQRRLSQEELEDLKAQYIVADGAQPIIHRIETVFESTIYRLGKENIGMPIYDLQTKSTRYNFIQIVTSFDIHGDFTSKKDSKRLYRVKLNRNLLETLFTSYNLIEMKDYKRLPDRKGYRVFYLHLARMIIIIRYRKYQGAMPYYSMTVSELVNLLQIDIEEPKYAKRKVKSVLEDIRKHLGITQFDYEFVKGEGQRFAYTVQFHFSDETLEYFNEKGIRVLSEKFHQTIVQSYVRRYHAGRPWAQVFENLKSDEVEKEQFREWLYDNAMDMEEKTRIYRECFMEVFQQDPQELGIDDFNFAIDICMKGDEYTL